jgi:hypothetical protein
MKYYAYIYECDEKHQTQVTWLSANCHDTIRCSRCNELATVLFGKCEPEIEDDLPESHVT